jgi:hypothetical protein
MSAMYLITVLLLTVVLPPTSIYAQISFANSPQSLMILVGTWFVFWCAGIRFALDGSLQFFRPKFTSEEILGIYSEDSQLVVAELGVTNLAIGLVGIASIVVPLFTLPVAIVAAIPYGVSGARHYAASGRSGNETAAMVSDLFVSAVLVLYVVYIGLGMVIGRV